MSTKTPESWASDPQARTLRVEVSSERSVLLPFDHFTFSELTSAGKEQRLRLVFSTHEVVVRGYALRRLETVMQRMELAFIAKMPDASRSLAADGQPMILRKIIFGNRSELGAHSLAINLSLLHTARAKQLDPIGLLQDLLLKGYRTVAAALFADSS